MAGLDDLAVLLAGNTYQKPDFSTGDPYAPLANVGQGIESAILQGRNNYSNKENLVGSLLTGLITGGLTDLSQGYQQGLKKSYNNEIINALQGGSSAVSDLPSPLFDIAQNNAKLFTLNRAIQNQDDNNKLNQQITLEAIKNPLVLKRLLASKLGASEPQPIATPIETPSRFPGGGESLQQKFKRLQQEQLDSGVPGGSATEAATKLLEADRKALKDTVDKVEQARQRATTLNEIAATAEAGIQGAGETGGSFGGIRNFLSRLYANVSDSETQKQTSQGILDSSKAELVRLNRSPGAVSDYETKMYLGAGPNSSNTPELNTALVGKMKNLAAVENNYADFLDAYREEKGTTLGADKLWQSYKAANPIFIKDRSGDVVINPSITPWQEFDFNKAAESGVNTNPGVDRSASAQGNVTQPTAPTPPPGYELTGKVDANGNYGIRKIQ